MEAAWRIGSHSTVGSPACQGGMSTSMPTARAMALRRAVCQLLVFTEGVQLAGESCQSRAWCSSWKLVHYFTTGRCTTIGLSILQSGTAAGQCQCSRGWGPNQSAGPSQGPEIRGGGGGGGGGAAVGWSVQLPYGRVGRVL